jgi:hypothetical protein
MFPALITDPLRRVMECPVINDVLPKDGELETFTEALTFH